MKEIKLEDLLNMAGSNVYDTEYSYKLTISCKETTYIMFKELKEKLKAIGVNVNNAQLFEYMTIEMFNSNLKSME
tara:strand:- start:420 stop:644 length:225 start_codon:yes stop_codon:yes gene_type:complete